MTELANQLKEIEEQKKVALAEQEKLSIVLQSADLEPQEGAWLTWSFKCLRGARQRQQIEGLRAEAESVVAPGFAAVKGEGGFSEALHRAQQQRDDGEGGSGVEHPACHRRR
jgi:hypothetical protein